MGQACAGTLDLHRSAQATWLVSSAWPSLSPFSTYKDENIPSSPSLFSGEKPARHLESFCALACSEIENTERTRPQEMFPSRRGQTSMGGTEGALEKRPNRKVWREAVDLFVDS